MGTNYHLHKPACASCGHEPPSLHIGKSSAGWVFALHVYPKEASPGVSFFDQSNSWGITVDDLPDWIKLFETGQYTIINEYGEHVSPSEMIKIISERKPLREQFELKRWEVEHLRVLGPGAGTWDRHVGSFS